MDQAVESGKKGVALEPASPEANMWLGEHLYAARQYDAAVKQLSSAVELGADNWFAHLYLGLAYEQSGNFPHAIEELQKANKLVENEIPWPLAELGHLYGRMGKTAEAERVLGELENWSKRSYVPPYFFALVNAGLGRKDQVFANLEKAYADRSMVLAGLKTDPEFDGVHGDPRYADLLRRMGLGQ